MRHQMEDAARVVDSPYLFIASEMRTGKTKIVIDGAQFLFEMGLIDKVLVVAPAPVRYVWSDRVFGELAKHLWYDLYATITEYHSTTRTWHWCRPKEVTAKTRKLEWFVTNYEFIRSAQRLQELVPCCGPKTLLVLDESSYVKNHLAQQTKACLQLRRLCGRVILINGTPLYHSPRDLFSQGNILHPSILECKFITAFLGRYAIQESVKGRGGKPLTTPYGKAITTTVGWRKEGLEDLQRRFAPYTIRRLQADCLDLPPKLAPVTLTATLTPETWKPYREMRDELVVWLKSGDVATSSTAAIKALRLSQITGGFLSGIERGLDKLPDGLDLDTANAITIDRILDLADSSGTVEIGREKLDVLLWFLGQRLDEDKNFKVVVWCRFRAELNRMIAEVGAKFPQFAIGAIHGGQKTEERNHALSLLAPNNTEINGPVFLGGTFGTGSFGLNLSAAHTSVTMSSDYSPGKFAQSADRVYGPGQKHPVAYFDIVAVGPKGQRTIDHAIIGARQAGESVANWTSAAWVNAITEE